MCPSGKVGAFTPSPNLSPLEGERSRFSGYTHSMFRIS